VSSGRLMMTMLEDVRLEAGENAGMTVRGRAQRGRGTRRTPAAGVRRHPLAGVALVALALLLLLLTACATDPQQAAAQQSKSKLDAELHHARVDLGVPTSLLAPIEQQERTVAAGAGGSHYSYRAAAANYALLYTQLVGVEQTAAQTLRTQAESDLEAFSTILTTRRAQGFTEANAYAARLDAALRAYATAHTPGDYARVDDVARGNSAALTSLWPAWQELLRLRDALHAVHLAGLSTALADAEYSQDLQAFADASPTSRYQTLVGVIDGQILQLMADETEALPYIGQTLLDIFQARIDDLRAWGESSAAATFQRQHDDDQQTLNAARTLPDYLTLSQIISSQTAQMTLPWFRGQAREDLRQLQTQVNAAMAQQPTQAYEYADQSEGIGAVAAEFKAARSVDGYSQADADIRVLLTNLRALQDNLRDPTVPWQAHATDLQLMQTYGVMRGKVIVVSLTEQTARLYQNGALVYWSYVTTGRPELPSPPGLHYAMQKLYHTQFVSGDPRTSPLWYGPTAINYAILYANYGYFVHDAWWRYKFGPGSNLPHWDPLAFNGGSHGCVNVPEENMAWIYNWTALGTPIILY
jgi:hypothetical protein